jgi:hypothetical protein
VRRLTRQDDTVGVEREERALARALSTSTKAPARGAVELFTRHGIDQARDRRVNTTRDVETNMTAAKIKVLCVDDSALIRSLMTEIINSQPDMEVVGTAPIRWWRAT